MTKDFQKLLKDCGSLNRMMVTVLVAIFSFIAFMAALLALIDPNINHNTERAVVYIFITGPLFLFALVNITRCFTVTYVMENLGLNDDKVLLDKIEQYHRNMDTFDELNLSDAEIDLIVQYRQK